MKGTDQSIDLLKEDAKNARRMPRERLAGLRVSMSEFGDLSRITWNEQLNALVCGHQRMKVLRATGVKTWQRLSDDEGVIVNPKTKERFSIRIVRWELEKHRAAQLVANNPHIQGEYTGEVVAQLRELEESVMFAATGLAELQRQVDKELAEVESDLEKGGGDRGVPAFEDKFMVIVECKDDVEQRALLERLSAEGLGCRALIQ